MAKERSSAFEWLRILAMATIVLGHACALSGVDCMTMTNGFNRVMVDFLTAGNLGVGLFVMLTGYFSADSKFRSSKILKMMLQTYFYLFVGLIVDEIAGNVTRTELRNSIFPILTERYWFYSVYIVLYLLSPFLTHMFRGLSRRQYVAWIAVGGVLWGVIPVCTLLKTHMSANALVELIYIYSLGLFVRLHVETSARNLRIARIAIPVSIAITLLSIAIPYAAGWTRECASYSRLAILWRTSPTILAICMSMMCLMKEKSVRVKHHRWVNAIAGTTFGIYLFHDNNHLRYRIWHMFGLSALNDSPLLIPALIGSAAIVFCASVLIELLRQHTVERFTTPIVYRICDVCRRRFLGLGIPD